MRRIIEFLAWDEVVYNEVLALSRSRPAVWLARALTIRAWLVDIALFRCPLIPPARWRSLAAHPLNLVGQCVPQPHPQQLAAAAAAAAAAAGRPATAYPGAGDEGWAGAGVTHRELTLADKTLPLHECKKKNMEKNIGESKGRSSNSTQKCNPFELHPLSLTTFHYTVKNKASC